MKKAVSVLLTLVMLITAVSGVTVEAYAAAKPKATSISSVTAKSGAFTVKWKKVKSVTGYQVQYSTNKKFKKNNKTVKVSKSSKTSKTISKLRAKKKYYVRVRTYKKGKKKTAYSTWSKSKSVITKPSKPVWCCEGGSKHVIPVGIGWYSSYNSARDAAMKYLSNHKEYTHWEVQECDCGKFTVYVRID